MPHMDVGLTLAEAAHRRRSGDFDGAVALLDAVVQTNPGELQAYLEAGQTEMAAGRISRAIPWYQRAELVAPLNFWPYFLHAEALQALGRYADALAVVEVGLDRCKGASSDLEYVNLIKRWVDIKALCEADPLASPPFLAQPSIPGRPLPGGLHATVVKDAEDVIYASLEASFSAGLRYYAIADNGSTDRTRIEIERFRAAHTDCTVFVVSDPVIGHYQSAKTMALVGFASTALRPLGVEIDWIFPLDCDELLYVAPGRDDLAGLLSPERAAEKNLLVYYHYNAGASVAYPDLPSGADVERLFPHFARLEWNPVRKVAFRNGDAAFIEEGNHFCAGLVTDPSEILRGSQAGVFLRHYPVRSLQQLRLKIVNGGKSIAVMADSGIGAHWRADYLQFQARGDTFLAERLDAYNRSVQRG